MCEAILKISFHYLVIITAERQEQKQVPISAEFPLRGTAWNRAPSSSELSIPASLAMTCDVITKEAETLLSSQERYLGSGANPILGTLNKTMQKGQKLVNEDRKKEQSIDKSSILHLFPNTYMILSLTL